MLSVNMRIFDNGKIKEEFEADLVISVDCGIRSVAEVIHANEIGLDMIITDHHSLGPEMPPATAVINPNVHSNPLNPVALFT